MGKVTFENGKSTSFLLFSLSNLKPQNSQETQPHRVLGALKHKWMSSKGEGSSY